MVSRHKRTGTLCNGLHTVAFLIAATAQHSSSWSLLVVRACALASICGGCGGCLQAGAGPHLGLRCEEVQGPVGSWQVGLGLQEAADVSKHALQDRQAAAGGGRLMGIDDRPLQTRGPVREPHAFVPFKLQALHGHPRWCVGGLLVRAVAMPSSEPALLRSAHGPAIAPAPPSPQAGVLTTILPRLDYRS